MTEGDSAKALAVAGLTVVGRQNFGVFPVRGKPPKRRAARGKAGPAAPRALTKQSVEYVEHAAAWVARYGADFHTVLLDKHQGTVGWEFLGAPQASAVGRYYRAMVQASAPPPLFCAFVGIRTA